MVVFALPGGATKTIYEAELKAGAHTDTYRVRAHPDEAGSEFTRTGLPVQTALAGQDYGYLTIPRPNGTTAYLPGEWFEGEGAFEGGKPAIFSFEEGSTRFVRPLLANKPEDVNAEDNIATPSGEALTIGVHTGHVVEVTVTPSTTSTTAGSAVWFTASVVGGGAFNFTWTFGDGSSAEGAEVSHSFSGSGTYLVRATATGTGGDESGGESGPVSVVVGDPPSTETPGASTTPQAPKAKPTGSPGKGREGRGGKGTKPAPGGGSKEGSQISGDSSAQRGDSPSGRTRASASTESPAPSVAAPSPEPSTVPPPTPAEPAGRDSPEPSGCCSGESPPAGSPRPSQSAGELVEGRLVGDDLGPATVAEAVGGSTEGEGSRSAPGAVGKGGFGMPVVALIVVALLAGGALFEWRRSRPTV